MTGGCPRFGARRPVIPAAAPAAALGVMIAGVVLTAVALNVAVLGLALGAEAGVPKTSVPDIDSCVSRLNPQLDIGYDRIAARCPELMKELEQGSWSPWLPKGWKEPGNDLSAGGLRQFRELVELEDSHAVSHRPPDVARLKGVLTGLVTRDADSRWTRFKAWLRSILERREEASRESWFNRMTSRIGVPQAIRQIIAYAALAAVVLLAAGIIFNELRTAGVLPGRRTGRHRARPGSAVQRHAAVIGNLEDAPLRERPGLLLGMIARRLSERGFLPPSGALTVRELTHCAHLSEPVDRARLSDLALASERVRFAYADPDPDALGHSLSGGHELLQKLETGVS